MVEVHRGDGTARVPLEELKCLLNSAKNPLGLDIGSGLRRSTKILREHVATRIIALDKNLKFLQGDKSTSERVQARAELLPFSENIFDFIALIGLMTTLVNKDPQKSKEQRASVVREVFRCLKKGGLVVVSDFSTTYDYSKLPTFYRGYELITGEYGTIALYEGTRNPINDLSDDEILKFAEGHQTDSFVHHYSPTELTGTFNSVGFNIISCKIEPGIMPSGRSRDAIILVASKPK